MSCGCRVRVRGVKRISEFTTFIVKQKLFISFKSHKILGQKKTLTLQNVEPYPKATSLQHNWLL
jgi:hypothetical protein